MSELYCVSVCLLESFVSEFGHDLKAVLVEIVPQGVKMEAPSHPNGNRQEIKGPAAEGVALKICMNS